MRSITRNWSRSEKVGAGMVALAILLPLGIIVMTPDTGIRETKMGQSRRIPTTPSQSHLTLPALPAATKTPTAPIDRVHVTPVGMALSDDSGKGPYWVGTLTNGDGATEYQGFYGPSDDSGKCSHEGGWWLAPGHEGEFLTKAQCEAFLESIPRHSWDFLSAPAYDLPSHCLFNGQMWLTEDRTIHVCKEGKWQDANDHKYHPNPKDYWM